MDRGLDALIEFLLTEIAFSGTRGCSISALLNAIESFYNDAQNGLDQESEERPGKRQKLGEANASAAHSQDAPRSRRHSSTYDAALVSKVWQWLVARGDVSVGVHRKFNHLTLDDILALPEEEDVSPSTDNASGSSTKTSSPQNDRQSTSKGRRETGGSAQTYRPRLHVSEERQWKLLAGHGPDLKRLPLFEWKALVDIASVKEKGILQGDLVRLTGQDKRSLPTRTDALARKGYIIKQPMILRGCRSSKLWLARYTASARVNRDGLNLDRVDLSKEALTKDLGPVPFSDTWNGERIDYIAIAQTFNAMVKAWGVMRYSDIRAKLDVENRIPQMRALAKTSRWFTSIGAVTFVAARFSNNQRLYKDCVKFVREPTADEWKVFRTTPTAHIKVPSARLGKRGQASRAKYSNEINFSPHSQAKLKRVSDQEQQNQLLNSEELTAQLWTPYKPIVNTTFEIIKRAGSKGSSNGAIGHQTLGGSYRKYVAALTAAMSLPDSQPPHLSHFEVTSQLNRLGKTMTYQFFATDELDNQPTKRQIEEGDDDHLNADGEVPSSEPLLESSNGVISDYTFSPIVSSKFAPVSASSLSKLNSKVPGSRSNRGRKRKLLQGDVPANEADGAHRSKKAKITEHAPTDVRSGQELAGAGNIATEQPAGSLAPPPPVPAPLVRPPGVYREPDNSLDPPNKKGRRRKSLVLTFNNKALKNPSFFQNKRNAQAEEGGEPSHQPQSPQSKDVAQTSSQATPGVGSTMPKNAGATRGSQPLTKRGRKGIFRCERCGNIWKNSNGLEYHLTKSRTDCNPAYVPPPPPPPPPPKPKSILKNKSIAASNGEDHIRTTGQRDSARKSKQAGNDGNRLPRLPSKRLRPNQTGERQQAGSGSSRPDPIRSSVILQDVEAYDIIDHRRRRENSPAASLQADRSFSHSRQTSKALLQTASKQSPRSRQQDILRAGRKEKDGDLLTPLATSQRKRKVQAMSHDDDRGSAPKGTPEMRESADGSGHGHKEASREPETESMRINVDELLAPRKSRKASTYTVGMLRRDRVTRIIRHLLDSNDGVFPGQKSLYYAIVSFWVKNHSDIEPPDWKVCQMVAKSMEKAGALFQLHFCFLDDNNKFQDCCVLVKLRPGETYTAELAESPKVDIVKEKIKEMFPIPYVPEAFSLSEEANRLFNALALTYRDMQQSGGNRRQTQKSSVIKDIEVLHYPDHIVGDASAHVPIPKRRMEEDEPADTAPTKRVRLSTANTSSSTLKNRKRSEHWDNGKLAKYIWNKKQKPDEKWNQKQACLQDYATGSWSTLPQETTSSRPELDAILSSIQTSRQDALNSTQPNSSKGRGKMSRKSPDPYEDEDSAYATDESILAAMAKGANSILVDRFIPPKISTSFVPDDSISDDSSDDATISPSQISESDDNLSGLPDEASTKFLRSRVIRSKSKGYWPSLPTDFFESDSTSFTLVGKMPDAKWFLRENLPQSARDIVKSFGGKVRSGSYADPLYGKYLRQVNIIEKWEQSLEGSQVLLYGSIAPDYIFVSLSPDISRANMKPTTLEWPSEAQYTAANIPEEIKNASPDNDNAGLPAAFQRARGRPKKDASGSNHLSARKLGKKPQPAVIAQMEINYKTRYLTPITVQHRGRVNKPQLDQDNTGVVGETELIAAFVVVKTLLGGVDRKTDLGLILKTFPGFSHSALKRFWPRVSKARKTYIEALTAKFQSSFLQAYEAGNIPPLNYDDLESYDWKSLITWATKLETHENVNLPESRHAMEKAYSVEKIANEVTDWRETWFHSLTSMYSRIEATSAEPISMPLNYSTQMDEGITKRARSWVRSLCVTPIKGAGMPEEIRAKLLRLSGGDETEANKLLKKVVDRLTSERVAARSKGKILGQSLRLHGVFAKQLERTPTVNRFRQAANFKARLDEIFDKGEDFFLPYAAPDGTIIAVLNLQAHGRIHLEPVGIPDIPFGFEPGNYDGRTYPKSYYHFKVKISPTENYTFDRDLPVLQQAVRIEPPRQGPRDMIPIWVDFFGNLNMDRWITYLSMTVMALATKAPLTPEAASVLMKPFVEPFEAKLIMDWVDGLGILQRIASGQSATVDEWWWLVMGRLVLHAKGDGDGLPQSQK